MSNPDEGPGKSMIILIQDKQNGIVLVVRPWRHIARHIGNSACTPVKCILNTKNAVHFKASVDRGRSGLESSWWAAHGNLINVDTLYIGSSYKPPATTVAFSMFFYPLNK